MSMVNMLDAKTRLSKLVDALERGEETEIIIARNGKPAARLVPLSSKPAKRQLGLAEGKYPDFSMEDFNALDAEVQQLFEDSANELWEPEPPVRKR